MNTSRMLAIIALVAGLVVEPATAAALRMGQARSSSGSFVVDVVDAWHGSLIGGAKVQLLDKKGKVKFEGVTNARGRLEAWGIPPGRYALVIQARACKRFERSNLAIPAQGIFEADVTPNEDDDS